MAKRNITYHWGDRTLLITLGNKVSRRIRALYVAELIATLTMATIFLMQSFPFHHNIINWIAAIGAAFLYLAAAYRFLARIYFKEQLLLSGKQITIIRNTLLSRHASRFDWRNVSPLHYEGKPNKTDHPLKGNCFDYFGFETQEHLIQSLHHEGNMYFDTPSGRIYFAPGVYSWEAEKMVQIMKLYCGNMLQLGPEWDDMLQEEEEEMDDAASEN